MIAELDPIGPLPASTWQPGAQGVFAGLASETYHKALGVSHSMLRNMDPPARLPAYLTEPCTVTEFMVLGTLCHHMILEPEKPLPKIIIQPDTYPAPPDSSLVKTKKVAPGEPIEWNNNSKYCKRWNAEAHEAGLIVLTDARRDSLIGMVKSVSVHPAARSLLENCDTEVSVFLDWTRGAGRVLRKGRMDIVPRANVLADLKTCEDASPEEFAKKLADGYATQAAYYLDLWNEAMPHDQREGLVFIAVERKPPFLVACYVVDPIDIAIGRRLNQERLAAYLEACRENRWGGFSEGFQTISMPGWARSKMKGVEL